VPLGPAAIDASCSNFRAQMTGASADGHDMSCRTRRSAPCGHVLSRPVAGVVTSCSSATRPIDLAPLDAGGAAFEDVRLAQLEARYPSPSLQV
jgi:hypothetical protein